MTQFDLLVILLLSISGLIGCLRGATREIMTVLAFALAVLAAVFGLRFTGPPMRHWLHPDWLANSAAALAVFIIVYLACRFIGARLAHNVREVDSLSLLDRILGLGFGLVRGLVLLGVFQMLLGLATPADSAPKWISQSTLYPLAVDSAKVLRLLGPQSSAMAGALAPALQHAVTDPDDSSSPTSDSALETPK